MRLQYACIDRNSLAAVKTCSRSAFWISSLSVMPCVAATASVPRAMCVGTDIVLLTVLAMASSPVYKSMITQGPTLQRKEQAEISRPTAVRGGEAHLHDRAPFSTAGASTF